MWEGTPFSEMISPSTCDASTAIVEDVVPKEPMLQMWKQEQPQVMI
jgi:hypothetical protein